ncbi:CRISPR-associated endonuclease Cas3'' [Roseococcus pinisoli]|uniref:CRISPR-associated endonuclease Cas3 n=1 Tax=Roseococcus pinisoli TaxID=2835040 RepID=A0ABS5QBG0_9PROT|nr:CRISPR-associated endonuclease Cas3'' [Roseococcus pinisoli]MBS7810262.1 CRISPR-associated endonuclease Cas3'' [Roseococcus pinisoli]
MIKVSQLFWGKARPEYRSEPQTHPLIAHSLDVAAVVVLLRRAGERELSGQTLGFLVALHDIGKFSRPFQAMAPDHWPTAALGHLPASGVPAGPKHDALGYHMLRRPLAATLDRVLPPRIEGRRAWNDGGRSALLRGLTGHHGRPPASLNLEPGPVVLCRNCLDAAEEFVVTMERIFAPPPVTLPADPQALARLGWRLAGLTTLADWVASRQAWFPYVSPEAVVDPADYLWNHAMTRAAGALSAAGLTPARSSVFTGIRGLFPRIAHRVAANRGVGESLFRHSASVFETATATAL